MFPLESFFRTVDDRVRVCFAYLFFFVVIYKLFKIYITISLQYNYCLVWLSSSSFESIFSFSHFQFTVSQIMATFFFFCLCRVVNLMELIYFIKTFVRKLFAIEIRCSVLSRCAANWLFYINHLLFLLCFKLQYGKRATFS